MSRQPPHGWKGVFRIPFHREVAVDYDCVVGAQPGRLFPREGGIEIKWKLALIKRYSRSYGRIDWEACVSHGVMHMKRLHSKDQDDFVSGSNLNIE